MDYVQPYQHFSHHPNHDQLISQMTSGGVYNDHQYGYTLSQHQPNMMNMANGQKTNETKPRLGKDEVDVLEFEFNKNPKPTTQTKRGYADSMGVELSRINVRTAIEVSSEVLILICSRTGSRIVEPNASKRRKPKHMRLVKRGKHWDTRSPRLHLRNFLKAITISTIQWYPNNLLRCHFLHPVLHQPPHLIIPNIKTPPPRVSSLFNVPWLLLKPAIQMESFRVTSMYITTILFSWQVC